MEIIPIAKLTLDAKVQLRKSIREATVRRYVESFENLPRVLVVKTKTQFILADGFHRFAAAERLGKHEIEAEIRSGTFEDALEVAAVANSRNAEPLTNDERDEGIRRLRQLHSEWSLRQIGKAMSVSYVTVKRVFDIDKIKHSLGSAPLPITPSHYREIVSAPREYWKPLINAVESNHWSVSATTAAIKRLKSDHLSDVQKRQLFAVTPGAAGSKVVEPASSHRGSANGSGVGADPGLTVRRALNCIRIAQAFELSSIIKSMGPAPQSEWLKELEDAINFLQMLHQRIALALGSITRAS